MAFFLVPRSSWGGGTFVDLIIAGYFATSYLLAILRGLGDQGSGPAQVKLCDAGIRQGTRGLGPLPYEANQNGKLVPWRKVREVQFNWRGWYGEVQFTNRKSFWRPYLHREYVHANFTCTKTEFLELRKRVRQWLANNNCAAALERMTEDAQSG